MRTFHTNVRSYKVFFFSKKNGQIYLSYSLTMAMDSRSHQLFFISFMIGLYKVQEANVHILNADWSIEAV